MNVDLGVLNVYLKNLIFHMIGSGILNVVLQIFSVLHCNCSSVILRDLPPELPLNFLGSIKNYPAYWPAVCKKFLQSQLGSSINEDFLHGGMYVLLMFLQFFSI